MLSSCTLLLNQCQTTLIAARCASSLYYLQKIIELYPPYEAVSNHINRSEMGFFIALQQQSIFIFKKKCHVPDGNRSRYLQHCKSSHRLPIGLTEISNTMVPITFDRGAFLLHHYTQPKLCGKAFPAMYIQKVGLCFENRQYFDI